MSLVVHNAYKYNGKLSDLISLLQQTRKFYLKHLTELLPKCGYNFNVKGTKKHKLANELKDDIIEFGDW